MARSLITLSSRILLSLAFAAAIGAVGCSSEGTDEEGAEIVADEGACDQGILLPPAFAAVHLGSIDRGGPRRIVTYPLCIAI